MPTVIIVAKEKQDIYSSFKYLFYMNIKYLNTTHFESSFKYFSLSSLDSNVVWGLSLTESVLNQLQIVHHISMS